MQNFNATIRLILIDFMARKEQQHIKIETKNSKKKKTKFPGGGLRPPWTPAQDSRFADTRTDAGGRGRTPTA